MIECMNQRANERTDKRTNERIIVSPNERTSRRTSERSHHRTNEQRNERVNDRITERTNKRTNKRTHERTNARTHERTNARTHERTNERMSKWGDELENRPATGVQMNQSVLSYGEMDECVNKWINTCASVCLCWSLGVISYLQLLEWFQSFESIFWDESNQIVWKVTVEVETS